MYIIWKNSTEVTIHYHCHFIVPVRLLKWNQFIFLKSSLPCPIFSTTTNVMSRISKACSPDFGNPDLLSFFGIIKSRKLEPRERKGILMCVEAGRVPRPFSYITVWIAPKAHQLQGSEMPSKGSSPHIRAHGELHSSVLPGDDQV